MFDLMGDEDKRGHVINLWKKAYIKSKAGAQLIRFFEDLSSKIYLFGVSKKLEEIEDEEVYPSYILLPTSTVKSYWNMVNVGLLLYTALYMPFRIAFLED